MAVIGTFSEGLRMKAFPTVTAIGNIHSGTMAGKLNGVMPATTPSGSRRTSQLTPRLTSSTAPSSRFWRESANSTTSIPLLIPAAASARVLPASSAARLASSARCSPRSSWKRNSGRVRSLTGVARQAGKAARAPATTASTSAGPERSTLPTVDPV